MTPLAARAKDIFLDAVEISSPQQRSAFLDGACLGDEELRSRVDALIEAHERPESLLDRAAVGAGPTSDNRTAIADITPFAEGRGTIIGSYKLLEQIGEGGMGVVFMAEQSQPVRRKVALKVIKPGMDTRQVIARFEAERQALALMDHPNIARIFDGGVTASGRPYFVMELVKGLPITDFCDRNRLTPRQRLELFLPVCGAIQHAHQKGIIHRDLKPSNVLVSMHDVTPVVKVIDFGVAKALGQELTDKTLFTGFAQMVGTPLYMSPEQAGQSALDTDTRSDIYTLGVLLYELLTGTTPFAKERFGKAAFDEIRRIIREEEPPRPSTRLSESGDALPSISALRDMEPVKLTKLVRGELDWIVMKSLEKDRTRRYETANGFARDIQRYLDGDTVEACPPSASYKLRKFARKHRAALATAGAFALLLVVATTVSVALALRADRERVRAKDREAMAIDAVRRYGEVVGETPELKNNPSLSKLRATLLKEPQAFFKRLRDRLQADRATTPDSLARLAQASFDLGHLTDEIGDKEGCLRAYEESLAIRERLASERPAATQFQRDLAASHHNIGFVQWQTGRPAVALASLEQARAIQERLARENPAVTLYQSDLAASHDKIGTLQSETGRQPEALASYERAWAIRERLTRENAEVTQFQSELAESYCNIGNLQGEMGQPAEAMASYERARAILERLARENAGITLYQRDLAAIHGNISNLQREMGQPVEALASHEQTRAIFERLARENPAVTQFQSFLATSHKNIGLLQRTMSRPVEALASLEQGRAIFERLTRENPAVTQFQSGLAQSHENIGTLQSETGQPAEALASYERARAINERLAREDPSVTQFQSELAESHHSLGRVQFQTGRPAEALVSFEQARAIFERLMRENPAATNIQSDLARSLLYIGAVQRETGRPAEGLGSYERARAIQERLARDHPESPRFASILGATLSNMALIDLDRRQFDEAQTKLLAAVKWQRKALTANPSHPTYRELLIHHLSNLVRAASGLGHADHAAKAQRELDDILNSDPQNVALDARLADLLKGLAPRDDAERIQLALRAYGKSLHASSARLYAEALANDAKLGDDRQAQHRYNAACAAALAASGQGKNDPPPDDAAKAKLREQAREWLQAELAAWAELLGTGSAEMKAEIAPTLQHWKTDADLAGLRDERELAKLTEVERAAFRQLWTDLDGLLAKAAVGK